MFMMFMCTLTGDVIRNILLILFRTWLCSHHRLDSSWHGLKNMLKTYCWDSGPRWHDCMFMLFISCSSTSLRCSVGFRAGDWTGCWSTQEAVWDLCMWHGASLCCKGMRVVSNDPKEMAWHSHKRSSGIKGASKQTRNPSSHCYSTSTSLNSWPGAGWVPEPVLFMPNPDITIWMSEQKSTFSRLFLQLSFVQYLWPLKLPGTQHSVLVL